MHDSTFSNPALTGIGMGETERSKSVAFSSVSGGVLGPVATWSDTDLICGFHDKFTYFDAD